MKKGAPTLDDQGAPSSSIRRNSTSTEGHGQPDSEPKSCAHFNTCASPLCPLDRVSLIGGEWFANEPLCRRRDLAALWLARARKIARAITEDPERGFFTKAMVERRFRITAALKGLDPADGPATQARVANWLKAHPAVRTLTAEERQNVRQRLLRNIAHKAVGRGLHRSETALEQGREMGGVASDVSRGGEVAG